MVDHPETIIELSGVEKHYPMGAEVLRALKGIDLKIQSGDYISVLGPSGGGKSTLLNILGCLDQPTLGTYHLEGKNVSTLGDDDLSAVRGSRLGFIFQSYNLIPQLTVIENIQVPMFYQGRDEGDSYEIAAGLAEKVGLGHRLNHRPNELSGGQQQRVAIARSITNDPAVIFADEATGNLDSRSGGEILEIFDDLSESGKTLVMITHDEEMAKRTSRVIRLRDGKIESDERKSEQGSPSKKVL